MKRTVKRKVGWAALTLSLVVAIAVGITDLVVGLSTQYQLFSDVSRIPKNKVGLLLGTSKYKDKGRKIVNDYYQNRIDAAVELYMAGKIDYIIVSGDNSTIYYNEPLQMKEDLVAKGVPVGRIILDNAGFRTLDSILRCRDVYGQQKFTIISQAFHNKRACFIANHKQLTTVAYNAPDGVDYWTVNLREKFARIKMLGDLALDRKARFYGEKVEIK